MRPKTGQWFGMNFGIVRKRARTIRRTKKAI
jgi:hypothetical protein